jgi:hypothetical protein
MARDPRLTALRGTLFTRRTGWAMVAVLAILGILLGAQPLTRAADLAAQALGDAVRLVLDVGWLLLLLGAAGLAAGLYFLGPRRQAWANWLRQLRRRLTTRPGEAPPLPRTLNRRGRLWLTAAAAVALLVVLVLVVVVVPPRFTANRQFKTASEELKAQNDVRTTLLQGLGALLVLTGAAIGASVAYRGVRETRRQIAQTAADNKQQFTLTHQGQITDRYTKAVDQLGSEHVDVRLGGIYALERIARDSPDDRATIEEVLTAYVRGHAPWPPPPALPSLQAITQRLVEFGRRELSTLRRWPAGDSTQPSQPGRPDEEGAKPPRPAADVQAAVTVLGHRKLPPDGLRRLDLSGVNLQGADLFDANLQAADLSGANLQDADLSFAVLEGANLQGADLRRARLDARLSRADLRGARGDEATRWPAGWDRAKVEAQGVRYLD